MMRVREITPDLVEYVTGDRLAVWVERIGDVGEVRYVDHHWQGGTWLFPDWRQARTFGHALANNGDVQSVDRRAKSTIHDTPEPDQARSFLRHYIDSPMFASVTARPVERAS